MCYDSYDRHRDQSTSLRLLPAWELLPEPQTLRQIALKCSASWWELGDRWFFSIRLWPHHHKWATIIHWFNLENKQRRWMGTTRPKWASIPLRSRSQKFLQWYIRALQLINHDSLKQHYYRWHRYCLGIWCATQVQEHGYCQLVIQAVAWCNQP